MKDNSSYNGASSPQPVRKSRNIKKGVIIASVVILIVIVFQLTLNFVIYPSVEIIGRGVIHLYNFNILVEREVSWDELEKQPDYSSSWDWFDDVNSYSVNKLKKFMKKMIW